MRRSVLVPCGRGCKGAWQQAAFVVTRHLWTRVQPWGFASPSNDIGLVVTLPSPRLSGPFRTTPLLLDKAVTSEQRAANKPCSLMQEKLYELLADVDTKGLKFDRYFFVNSPGTKKHPPRDDLDDHIPRCLKCGCTIDEHTSAAAQKDEVDRFVQFVDSGSLEEAQATLMKVVEDEKAKRNAAKEAEEEEYCPPFRVAVTWGEDLLKKTLVGAVAELSGLEGTPRGPRVISLESGTGTGKTHALLIAPKLLGVDRGLYLTYNLAQPLSFDKSNPRLAALLRVLLRALGCDNVFSGKFLAQHADKLKLLSDDRLMELAASVLRKEGKSWFIGVDECRMLAEDNEKLFPERAVASVLGDLALDMKKNGVPCTVVLASLSTLSFRTASGRVTQPIRLPPPNEDTVRSVMTSLKVPLTPSNIELVSLVSGRHVRSMVVACRAISSKKPVFPKALFHEMSSRLGATFNELDRVIVQIYVRAQLKGAIERGRAVIKYPLIETFIDANGAVPPVFCVAAFDKCDGFLEGKHPAVQIFDPSCEGGAPKQLEECAAAYDRLRALFGATAIPRDVKVYGGSRGEESTWWSEAKAQASIAEVDHVKGEALFCVRGKTATRTDVRPEEYYYYKPSDVSHPLVDRAFVVTSPNKEKRGLIVFQDKINDDIAAASKALNKAAELLSDLQMPVLSVVHCVGAKAPVKVAVDTAHVVITEADLDVFYTPTFAPAVRYLLNRHATLKRARPADGDA